MDPGSVLYSPAENRAVSLPVCDHYAGTEAQLRKSLALQASLGASFDITADCEEIQGGEIAHAHMVGDLLASVENRFGRVGVRIHDASHRHWHSDLEIVIRAAGNQLAYVTVPKIERFDALERVIAAIDDVAHQCGVRREIPVHAQVETLGGLRAVWDLAAHPRVECVAFGLIDFVAAFDGALPAQAIESPGQFDHPVVRRAKTEIVMAAQAAGKAAAHNVCVAIDDPQAAARDATRAREQFGFTRMWSIHPTQIAPIVEALRPDAALIRRAGDILAQAMRADWRPMRHEGQLLDRASYRFWWGVLRRAKAAGAPLPEDIAQAFFAAPPNTPTRTSR